MSRNGTGTMSIPYPAFVSGATISSTEANANNSTIVSELTNSIPRDGQAAPTANLPMGGFKLTGLGSGSAASDSASLGQIAANAYLWCGTAGGTVDALTLTPSPAHTTYAAGKVFRFITSGANTGAATVNVSALGIKNIRKGTGATALAAGDLPASQIVELVYDGTQFIVQSIGLVAPPTDTNKMTLIQTQTASASATLDFVGLATVYNKYILDLTGVVPTTDAQSLLLQFSLDNGANFIATSYVWQSMHSISTGSGANGANTSDAAVNVTGTNVSNDATQGVNGRVELFNLGSSSKRKRVVAVVDFYDGTNYRVGTTGGNYAGATTVMNAIRLKFASGTIASGIVSLYGIKSA